MWMFTCGHLVFETERLELLIIGQAAQVTIPPSSTPSQYRFLQWTGARELGFLFPPTLKK